MISTMSFIEMSLYGGIFIIAITVLRAATFNKIPKTAVKVLWAAAFLRLTLPVTVTSPVSIYTAAERLAHAARRGGVLVTERTPLSMKDTAGLSGSSSMPGGVPVSMITGIWIAVAVIVALSFWVSHMRGKRIYRASLPVENSYVKTWLENHRLRRPIQIRVCDQIDSPLTYGILWPVILLPKNLNLMDENKLSFILAHEFAHIRRFDALFKWLLAALVCVHWFNPLVWVMYILANRDLELSCDDYVIRQYGSQARVTYALTLVGLEEHRSGCSPLVNSFCKNAMKERITAVMKSRKTTVISTVAALLMVAAALSLFVPNAQGESGQVMAAGEEALKEGSEKGALVQDINETEKLSETGEASGTEKQNETGKAIETELANGEGSDILEGKAGEEDWNFDMKKYALNSEYAKSQYDRLINAVAIENYEDMSIAEFNRKINAVFSSEEDFMDTGLYTLYEVVMSMLPAGDPYEVYLCNTVNASLTEYSSRMDEVYSGRRTDPSFSSTAQITSEEDVFGDKVTVDFGMIDYRFTYRILDQDKLTVRERDQFLQDVMKGVQDYLESGNISADEEKGEKEALEELKKIGKSASNEHIEFTGGEIDYFDIENKEEL